MSDRLSYLLTDHTGGLGTILVRNGKHLTAADPHPEFRRWACKVPITGTTRGHSKLPKAPLRDRGWASREQYRESGKKKPGAGGSLEGLIRWGGGASQLQR